MLMKLTYLIMAHKDFKILELLVDLLNQNNIDIIIHIDSKSEIDLDRFIKKFESYNYVRFLEKRIAVNWGGFSLLEAQLMLLFASRQIGLGDYVSFISGQDLPLKTTNEIIKFLQKNRGKEFIEFFDIPNRKWSGNGGKDRYEFFWLVDQIGYNKSKQFVEIQKKENIYRKFPHQLKPYGGSNWMTISKECAEYICEYIINNPKIIDYFKYTVHPDEMLFQTLILNSNFKDKVINDNLRYIDWNSSTASLPKILNKDDMRSLQKSTCHFARKFDTKVDKEIIDELFHSLKLASKPYKVDHDIN